MDTNTVVLQVLNRERHEMEIDFECKKCGRLFDCDVGTVTLPENSDRPRFEQKIFCPRCGELTIDEVLLTELGQSNLPKPRSILTTMTLLIHLKVSAKGVTSLPGLMILDCARNVRKSWSEI